MTFKKHSSLGSNIRIPAVVFIAGSFCHCDRPTSG
jgi:hypothetical protein